jgi:hypothetical protein
MGLEAGLNHDRVRMLPAEVLKQLMRGYYAYVAEFPNSEA